MTGVVSLMAGAIALAVAMDLQAPWNTRIAFAGLCLLSFGAGWMTA